MAEWIAAETNPGSHAIAPQLQFRKAIDAAILSERRVIAPYGMRGGGAGQKGKNIWRRKMEDGTYREINVGGKAEISVGKGDHFILRESRQRSCLSHSLAPCVSRLRWKLIPAHTHSCVHTLQIPPEVVRLVRPSVLRMSRSHARKACSSQEGVDRWRMLDMGNFWEYECRLSLIVGISVHPSVHPSLDFVCYS